MSMTLSYDVIFEFVLEQLLDAVHRHARASCNVTSTIGCIEPACDRRLT
jgi:hypothetical protein